MRFEVQVFATDQAGQAWVVIDHFSFDQLILALDFQGHAGDRAQWADIADLGCAMLVLRQARQRHLMRAEQDVIVVAQVQAVGVA